VVEVFLNHPPHTCLEQVDEDPPSGCVVHYVLLPPLHLTGLH
jgi:hypothetical protein